MLVWELMVKRTAWMEHSTLSLDEAVEAQEFTDKVAKRIKAVIQEIDEKLQDTVTHWNVARSYKQGR